MAVGDRDEPLVERAVDDALRSVPTRDAGGDAGTRQFGDSVVAGVAASASIPETIPEWMRRNGSAICECADPVRRVRAEWKGAARTHCARCGLPTRIQFALR